MKNKLVLRLVGVFILLLAVVILLNKPEKNTSTTNFLTINPADASSIQIQRGGESITLVKNGTGWQTASMKADQTKVGTVLDQLKSLPLEQKVSINPENHQQYGVASSSGILVTVAVGDKKDSFFVGNSGPSAGSFYIRKSDNDAVYLANGTLSTDIATRQSAWVDLPLVPVTADKLAKIEVRGASGVTAEKKDGKWNITGKGQTVSLDDKKAGDMESKLANLSATDIASDEQKDLLEKTLLQDTVVVTDTDGKTYEFSFVSDETNYVIQRKSDNALLVVSKDTLMPVFTALRAE